MNNRGRSTLVWTVLVMIAPLFAPARSDAALATGLIDRKFPVFSFCPIDNRGDFLVAFTAPSNGSVRVTFATDNFFAFNPSNPSDRAYNEPRIDNVMVVPRSVWESSQTACGGECYFQAGNFDPAPAFPSDAASVAGLPVAEFFDVDPFAVTPMVWEGGTWDTQSTAPKDDASGTNCSFAFAGGSLLLGQESDGDVTVSTALLANDLTPGVEYVVLGWLFVRGTNDCPEPNPCWAQVFIMVDETETVATERSTFGGIKARFD